MLPSPRGIKRRLQKALARHGVLGSVIHAAKEARNRMEVIAHRRRDVRELDQDGGFDEEFGVDTGGVISLSDLDADGENWIYGLCYVASAAQLLDQVLRELPIRHEEFVFVDVGSGKGRALLVASHLPFKRVVGVELSPALHSIAVQNIGRYRNPAQQCRDLQSICADAARYTLPDDPTVLYMYRPFEDRVLAQVMDGLRASLARRPREVLVVYSNPEEGGALERAEFLKLLWSDPVREIAVYSTR